MDEPPQLNICNRPISECQDCELDSKLFCTYKKYDSVTFAVPFLVFSITTIGGVIRAYRSGTLSLWGELLFFGGYFGYLVFFLQVWENRVMCSHCPYYGREDEKTLHCYANYGLKKLWAYHPEPMSRSERTQFLIGIAFLFFTPFIFLLLVDETLFGVLALCAGSLWVFILSFRFCTRCPNFSCPLNRVPKPTRDAYLRQNPKMYHAWRKDGYEID